jgi:hypothetical protein
MIICMFGLLPAMPLHGLAQDGSPRPASSAEYSIVRAVLSNLDAADAPGFAREVPPVLMTESLLVLFREDATSSLRDNYYRNLKDYAGLADSLLAAASQRANWEPALCGLSDSISETMFLSRESGRDPWNVIYKKYGPYRGTIQLSRPGFSRDGCFAAIQTSLGTSWLGGSTDVWLFEKAEGEWTPVWLWTIGVS